MNKEELETNKAALTLLASETNEKLVDYKAQVSVIEQQLEDLGKPEATPEFLDKISETITKAVEELEFDAEDIEFNLEMDYDNKVNIDTAELKDPSDIADKIYCAVELLFAEIIEKEDK
jgi:hypothetical protein